MAYYVIAGKTTCSNTTHAIHIAGILTTNLPNFTYRSVLTPESEWPTWLDQLNSTNDWYQTTSPVIWKEIGHMGGKAQLIGNLGEFWEYCYDYYGLQTSLSKKDLEKIMADNSLISSQEPVKHQTNVSIIGANTHPMLGLIVYDLQNIVCNTTFEIKLFDENVCEPEEKALFLEVAQNFRETLIKTCPQSLMVVSTMEEVLRNCDLLIVLTDYSRLPGEDADDWLHRCRLAMVFLADDINAYGKRSIRVVMNHHGPICLTASVLMEYSTTIRLSNIIAVTTDEGTSVIKMISEKLQQPVENFWCPPVWGFSGLMSYVNIANTPINHEVIRPYKRSLKSKESSTLPKGEVMIEMKLLENLIKTEDVLFEEIERRKEKELDILKRPPILAKVRALASLLKLWYAPVASDEIVSLGICSNGSFGLPAGICFSQPASLNERRIWEPVSNLPLSRIAQTKIADIVMQLEEHLKNLGIGERYSYHSNSY